MVSNGSEEQVFRHQGPAAVPERETPKSRSPMRRKRGFKGTATHLLAVANKAPNGGRNVAFILTQGRIFDTTSRRTLLSIPVGLLRRWIRDQT